MKKEQYKMYVEYKDRIIRLSKLIDIFEKLYRLYEKSPEEQLPLFVEFVKREIDKKRI
jgi:hypothetical protein